MPLILRVNDGKRQELFFICAISVTIYPPAEFQITIQTGNNCPSPLRAVAMQYTRVPLPLGLVPAFLGVTSGFPQGLPTVLKGQGQFRLFAFSLFWDTTFKVNSFDFYMEYQ